MFQLEDTMNGNNNGGKEGTVTRVQQEKCNLNNQWRKQLQCSL